MFINYVKYGIVLLQRGSPKRHERKTMASVKNKFIAGLMSMMVVASFGALAACGGNAATEAPAGDKPAAEAPAGDKAAAGAFKDGTYEGTGKGKNGDVKVSVTVAGGKITDVKVGDHSETEGIADKAIDEVPAAIVEKNGTEGVETASGATMTSQAIIDAVNQALESAK